jgi:L-aspartate oxidase
VPPWDVSDLRYDSDPALIQGDMETIRNVMWRYVGLVRARYRLTRAIRQLNNLWLILEDFYRRAYLTDDLIGLRNAAQTALLVTRAAMRNRTSRGCHHRDDSRSPGSGSPPLQNDQLEPAGGPG